MRRFEILRGERVVGEAVLWASGQWTVWTSSGHTVNAGTLDGVKSALSPREELRALDEWPEGKLPSERFEELRRRRGAGWFYTDMATLLEYLDERLGREKP